jgi:hypothetical protein
VSDTERRKLVLTEEDMAGPAAPAAPPPPADAPPPWQAAPPPRAPVQEFPTVGGVGAPRRVVAPGAAPPRSVAPGAPPALPAWLNVNTVIGRSIVAAAAGIALGWLIGEVTGAAGWPQTAQSKLGLDVKTGVWVALIGVLFTIVYAGWEHILARSPEGLLHVAKTSGPVGAGLGFVSGFIAQFVFAELLQNILESGDIPTPNDIRFYLARALAWGLFGMGMGAASAALIRSRQKLINGLIGGAIGGAVGGIVFHWLGSQISSEGTARLIGLLVVGIGIGVAIGLIETARRDAWLNVVGGAMTGKEFIVYEAETKIGSDPKCEIVLIKDPAIQPYHFVINTPAGAGQQRRTLVAYQGCAVTIQGQPVAQHTLRDGDVIGVGTTSIKYAERATQQSLAGGI